jgi:hypothetical protein
MLEKLGFRQLTEEVLTVKRQTKAMPMYEFLLAMVLACYVGFSRLRQLRFLKREPMLTGILRVSSLPPQSTFWRFLAALHLGVARQLLQVQRHMREHVWEAANVHAAPTGRRPTTECRWRMPLAKIADKHGYNMRIWRRSSGRQSRAEGSIRMKPPAEAIHPTPIRRIVFATSEEWDAAREDLGRLLAWCWGVQHELLDRLPASRERARRRVVAILEELRVAGLITYQLSTDDLTGPEPHMDVYAERDALGRQAPPDLSEAALHVWDQMRDGQIQNAVGLFDAVRRGQI